MTDLVWVISSSVLILAVILIRAIFGKRMNAGLRYALWGLVLIRLLIPGTVFQSPISVKSAVVSTEAGADMEAVKGYSSVSLVREEETGGAEPNIGITDPEELPLTEDGTEFREKINVRGWDKDKAYTVIEDVTPMRYERIRKIVRIRDVINIVWICGMAAAAVYFIFVNIRLFNKLRKNCVRLETEAPCRVYWVDGLSSSCLFLGAVYISKETAEDPDSLRYVLAHELAHRRHGDAFIALLRDAALVLHWYNPLVWLAAFLSRRDAEMFADTGAIKTLGEDERENYGMALIRLSSKHKAFANIGAAATTMTNGKRTLKERIKHMSKKTKTSIIIIIAAAVLAGLALLISFLGCRAKESAPQTSAEASPEASSEPTEEPTQEPETGPTEAPQATPEPEVTPVPIPSEGDHMDDELLKQITLGTPMFADLDGDGAEDAVLITMDNGLYGSRHTVVINLTGRPNESFVYQTSYNYYDTFAAAVDFDPNDGRREILLATAYDSSEYTTLVFRVNAAGTDLDVFDTGMGLADWRWYSEGVPEDYVFDPSVGLSCAARTEILGTFYVYGRFTVTDEGIRLMSEVFEYPDLHGEFTVGRVTLEREVTLELVDEELARTGESVTVPAGAVIFQRYTDRKSWVVVELEDGRLAAADVRIVDSGDDWGVYINGTKQDLLGVIAYAD